MNPRRDEADDNAMPDALRLDIWLWAARFFRTRALAKQAIETGKVEANGATVGKPSKSIRVGDVLAVQRGQERFEIQILGLSEQRGPAAAAQALYTESVVSRAARQAEHDRRRAERDGYHAPKSKPDKRARRLIRALGDIDAL